MSQKADSSEPQRRNTHQRALVLASVQSRCDHPTAEDVYQDVMRDDPRVSRATVYRNLHLLVNNGTILSIKTDGGERFDRRVDEHAHIMCTVCGRVEDAPFPDQPDLKDVVARATGYAVSACSIVYEGVCPDCQKAAMQSKSERASGE
jgi:Fe2+ or Zn2+ uptake regulation protein